LQRRYEFEAGGYDFDRLIGRVAEAMQLDPEEVPAPGKYAPRVRVRSLLRYWGARKPGMTTVELSEPHNLAQPSVSKAVPMGEKSLWI